ncbi:unnamed protein product [Microthlaspi erraticum]|uniref:Uncharacterized protein n=1 Tax=Microthlaspi erraticum TaxID=1685480 RepID=A0A6D2HM14_9BRAS|nr:unnamed protein product [Microthlaspi erraticum]
MLMFTLNHLKNSFSAIVKAIALHHTMIMVRNLATVLATIRCCIHAADQVHPPLVRDAFFCDWKSFRLRLRLTIVKTDCTWFIGVGQFSGIIPLKPDISVKGYDILHDDQYSRSSFGEGNRYKIHKIFWRLGRRIWDPGKMPLWRRHESEQEILYWYNLSLIRRQSKSWTRSTIKIQ